LMAYYGQNDGAWDAGEMFSRDPTTGGQQSEEANPTARRL